MVSSMLLGNASDLPEGFFDPLSQGLECFAKANTDGFDVGVRQHKMIEHVREWLTGNGHSQILHMGKIGLSTFAWLVSLWENHFLFRPIDRTPSGNVSLQRAHLAWSIAVWVSLTEQREQGGPRPSWIAFELFYHPFPILLKRILACLPVMRTLDGRWELTRVFIFAGSALTHPGTCRG
jgi:hypothetical protein